MSTDIIALETLLATQDSAKWMFWTMVATSFAAMFTVIGASVTLYAVLIARKGLHTWKEQQIITAKAEWIASLVNYVSGVSYLPEKIYWDNPKDKQHLERVAELNYECIKCWKVLQVYLENNKRLNDELMGRYMVGWAEFSCTLHNGYMENIVTKTKLKEYGIQLYNR